MTPADITKSILDGLVWKFAQIHALLFPQGDDAAAVVRAQWRRCNDVLADWIEHRRPDELAVQDVVAEAIGVLAEDLCRRVDEETKELDDAKS